MSPRSFTARRSIPLLATLASLAACAPTLSSPAALARIADGYSVSPSSRTSDFIGSTEIAAAGGGTAYDVVQRLRPQFLVARAIALGPDDNGGRPVVYLDGMRFGPVEELRTISASMVGEVRFLSPVIAGERFGRYHAGGVIAISTRRR